MVIRVRSGLEQDVVNHGLVLIGDVADRFGQSEDHVEVGHLQQLGLACLQPVLGGRSLALRAMAVAAGVVGDLGVGAVRACCHVAAERRRTTALDGRHDFQLAEAHVTGVGCTPGGPVGAEDIRDLQGWTGHGRGALGRRLDLLAFLGSPVRLGELLERALDVGDHAGGDTGVARRGIELVVTEQRLDDADISAALQEVGGKAMAQRMERHRLGDPGAAAASWNRRLNWRVVIARLSRRPGNSQRSVGGTPRS